MNYMNLNNQLEVVINEDKKYSRKDLISNTLEELKKSNIEVLSLNYTNPMFSLNVKYNDNLIVFDMYLKNITGAGWKDKLNIKRCQVSNMKENNNDKTFIDYEKHYNLILGYYNYDSNPIFVAWDPYRYVNHNTLRSCYVSVDILKRGYEKKYHEGVVSSQKCWIFKGEMFGEFVKNYLDYISFNYGEGK